LPDSVVQQWFAAWKENDLFSEPAIRHLQSLIPDAHCMVVITTGRRPISLVFRRHKHFYAGGTVVSDDPIISVSGKHTCDFMQALAIAHNLAQWTERMVRHELIIYAFDNSTWGSA